MFHIKNEQKVVKVGDVQIGGRSGENPVAMVSTMFYTGQKLIERRKEAKFDKKKAESLLHKQESLSHETGLPGLVDIVGINEEEFKVYIDFVAEKTEMPFMIDAWKIKPKIAAARYVKEIGLEKRAVYNSIAPWSEDIEREIAEAKDTGIDTCVVVAFNTQDRTVDGRLALLEDDLLTKAERAGFRNVLVDTSVVNLPSIAFTSLANRKIKEQLGLPVGCSPSNGTDAWKDAKTRWGRKGFIGIDAGINAIAGVLWNDFLLYGAIEHSEWIYPAVASAQSVLSTFIYDEVGTLPKGEAHPLNRFFREFAEQL